MRIRLEVYLPFRGERIWRGDEEVPEGITPAGLLEHLGLAEPDLAVLVDGRFAPADRPLREGAEVAILRRAEGGSAPVHTSFIPRRRSRGTRRLHCLRKAGRTGGEGPDAGPTDPRARRGRRQLTVRRTVKIGAVAAALAGVLGLGALAWAASPGDAASPPAAREGPKAPGWHRGGHGRPGAWSPGRIEQALQRDPAKVAERAQKALERVQKREEALRQRIAQAEGKLGTIQDPDLKRLAEARLEVARADLTRLQKVEEFLKALADVARSRAPSTAPSGAAQAS